MVKKLLNREFRFLHKSLNVWSRLFLLAAAVTVAVSVLFPLWELHLVAPQYSGGLTMQIYPYKIEGGGLNGNDINEINNLNHYIGMKKIDQADFTEMQIMPFMFGVFILLALRAVVFGEMKNVIDLFVIASYFGAFSIGAGNVLTATTNFGQSSTSGVNSNYAYQVRQFQFSGRIVF